MSFSGSVMVDIGDGTQKPLCGCWVDVYRFSDEDKANFEPLTKVRARTDKFGKFDFDKIPVLVEVRTLIHNIPPYETYEVTREKSLPNLAFRISLDSEVVGSTTGGAMFEEILDEREFIKNLNKKDYIDWKNSHPERINVNLSGEPPIQILIPAGNALATQAAGGISFATVTGSQFNFLRVGRVTRDEIGELGDKRPDFVDKPGYMRSQIGTFFPGIVDAPFGATLHIGGQFGKDLLDKEIYYAVSVWDCSKDPDNPLAGKKEQILDRLTNKRFIFATKEWETVDLGPVVGTITDVEPPHDPGLIGTSVGVYKRPALPNYDAEYWPFWDLVVLWNSITTLDDLRVLSLEAYEKIGGSDDNPQLKKIALTPPTKKGYDYLPLQIDNHPPVPKLLPFDPAQTARKFSVANAVYLGAAQQTVDVPEAMDVCNEMVVAPAYPDGNKCILMRYSVEDGQGNPHKHLYTYRLYAEFTPKAVTGAEDSTGIILLSSFTGNYPYKPYDQYKEISKTYSSSSATAPIMEVNDFKSVVVPAAKDGWPPQSGDTDAIPTSGGVCRQYAVEVGLYCSVRTIDGWGGIFGTPHVSRHIIIKKT